jgi:trehalose 6-phosphate phosphatase
MIFDSYKLPSPSPDWALFLDIDGTLIDIAPSPFQVEVPSSLPALLENLVRALAGAVALVTGRSLADMDRLFGPLSATVVGQHGAEIRRPGGRTETLHQPANGPLQQLLPRLENFIAERSGLLIEDKGHTIAVHYRLAPQFRKELYRFLIEITAGLDAEIAIVAGKRVFELKPAGISKGKAVEYLMQSGPFSGRTPVFIGDDTTDEDGFAAVKAAHGHAIRVGGGRESLATWQIPDPDSVRRFLAQAAISLAAPPHRAIDADA